MDPTGGILSYVVNKAGELISSEVALLSRTREDLEWVRGELRAMQAFLDHVAIMEIRDGRITTWIEEVRELAFHAEDVLDTYSVRAPRKSFLSFTSRRKFGTKITQLRKRVDELSKRRERYSVGIPDTTSAGTDNRTDELQQLRGLTADPYVEDKDVVGLSHHAKAVTELLDSGGSRQSVVSIVGMGGLGKTTLAKKVYNLLRSSSSWDCSAWIVVSQKYSISDLRQNIAREIMKLSSKDEQEMNQGTIKEKLSEMLQHKRYLIVLDDVWTHELWDTLCKIFPESNNGSRIIITTRNIEVARLANPQLPPYELPTLGEEDSRELFTKKAFPGEEDPEQCCTHAGLASLRDQIVKQCRGLPLAIVVAGGLLSRKKKTPEEWGKVAKKIDWQQKEQGGQCMGILALSYMDLPVHLRWCFLYLACLPEDCQASVDRLQRLWIAEGFIEERAGTSLEEEAERCLQELVQRCLLQLVQMSDRVDFHHLRFKRCCRVHDLVLELAVLEAEKMRFLDVWRNPLEGSSGGSLRRLSITDYREAGDRAHHPLGRNQLRTLLIRDRIHLEKDTIFLDKDKIEWRALRGNLKLVRVLDLALHIDGLLKGIGEMVNLRYLSLSGHYINKLPESVGNLRHLQTLDIAETGIECLPRSIWRIKTLRYLCGANEISAFPMLEASLTDETFNNLRVLHRFRVSPAMEKILPNLTHLRELELYGVGALSVTSLSNAIKELQCLHVLILHAGLSAGEPIGRFEMDKIFSATNSHEYLHHLKLRYFLVVSSQLRRLPENLGQVVLQEVEINHCVIKLLGNLNHLQKLRLLELSFIEEEREEMVFRTGWFPKLCVLHLRDLKGIKRWELEKQSMPLLEELLILRCSELEGLPDGLWQIGTLISFDLGFNNTQLQERFRTRGDRRREGKDWHKVQHIKHLRVSG